MSRVSMPAYTIPTIIPKIEVYAVNIEAFLTLTFPLLPVLSSSETLFVSPHKSYGKITDKAVATQCNTVIFLIK